MTCASRCSTRVCTEVTTMCLALCTAGSIEQGALLQALQEHMNNAKPHCCWQAAPSCT